MSTTGLQLALLGGLSIGAGVSALVWRLAPVQVDAHDAVVRLSAQSPQTPTLGGGLVRAVGGVERLGRWAMRTLPAGWWGVVPTQQLALLRISQARFLGEKVAFALLGMMAPALLSSLFAVMGLRLPVVVPVMASLAAGVVFFFIPNWNVIDDAGRARTEFNRALGAYIELIALERNSGSGTRQAMEAAAEVGDSWVFVRLREELAFSRWTGEPPWEALRRLSHELGLAELADLADILRLSGEEGSQIYSQLRARSASMRSALLSQDLAHANAVGEKLTIPMSALGITFITILIVPALLRVVGIT
ncbi:MAG: hypothetical protein L0G49_15100 [Luteococcus sp.]|uniref:type II secretion system F family protein n=1 Tax=Luteococcus sp. TaxID=1969402 RepID=UPI0026495AA3|nr:type II secretion system F family protein [Luteococcus sp.]MDN5565060.1 hypothetical protein [Luteococcus sp.]